MRRKKYVFFFSNKGAGTKPDLQEGTCGWEKMQKV